MTNALAQFPRKAATLQSRLSSLNVTLEPKNDFVGIYDKNGAHIGSKVVPLGLSITSNPTPAQCADAIREIELSFAPAPEKTIAVWIAELDAVTASMRSDDVSAHVKLEAYTRRLLALPADITEHVMTKEPWKWFPTWQEIDEIASPMVEQRKSIIRKLSAKMHTKDKGTESVDVKPQRLTPELKAQISAEGGFGDAPNVRGILKRMKAREGYGG